MRNIYIFILLATVSASVYATEGALSGKFTCDERGGQVVFSQGNLQYQASTNTWRFAEHQYDFVGNDAKGNVYIGETKCSNKQISATYSGWIDLFGFGTSGWNGGQSAYQPWSTSTNAANYITPVAERHVWTRILSGEYAGAEGWLQTYMIDTIHYIYPNGVEETAYYYQDMLIEPLGQDSMIMYDFLTILEGSLANADWGVYNAISNGGNKANMWHTPSSYEWRYILDERENAALLRGKGTVDTVGGCILLPDDWTLPEGLNFTPDNTTLEANHYTLSEWAQMEAAGAVFFPFAGVRSGNLTYELTATGAYMSTLCQADTLSDPLFVVFGNTSSSRAMIGHYTKKYHAISVRLVQRPTWTVTVPASAQGSVWVAEQGIDLNNVKDNTTLHLYAVPAKDYWFEGWSDGSTDNPRVVTVRENMTLEPIFRACEAQVITLNEQIEKGSSFVVGEHEYTRRGTYRDTLTAVNGCDSIVILNLEVVRPITCNLRVVLNDSTMGSVTGSGVFTPGTEVTITATPSSDKYIFIRWYNEDEYIDVYDNPYTFNLVRDLQLRAVFRRRNGKE